MDSHKNNLEIILAQWQTCVEMANSVSQRRDTTNNVFITINLAIVAAFSSIENFDKFILFSFGIMTNVLWFSLIRNFQMLNEKKFEIINEIEKQLPLQPFNEEWNKLQTDNVKKYHDFTKIERYLPFAFCFFYLVYLVY